MIPEKFLNTFHMLYHDSGQKAVPSTRDDKGGKIIYEPEPFVT